MKISTHKAKPMIDFMDFMEEIEEKYGFKYRDMAGKYSKENREHQKQLKNTWLSDNGYEGKAYVLDCPEGSQEDWNEDSEEMKLRIEINTKIRPVEKTWELPYLDGWHYFLANDFVEFRRGGANYMYFEYEDNGVLIFDDEVPDWIQPVYQAIFNEVRDHEAFDGDCVCFHIDW